MLKIRAVDRWPIERSEKYSRRRMVAGVGITVTVMTAVLAPSASADSAQYTTPSEVRALLSEISPSSLEDLANDQTGKANQKNFISGVPADASDPIVLSNNGAAVEIRLPFREQSVPRVETGGVVFNNRNGSSTAPLLKSDGSVQIFTVIENEYAPSEYRYEFDLPTGTTMKVVQGGSVALVTNTGEFVAGIAPAWAIDSDGNKVETTYRVSGSALIQTVSHREGGLAFPVVAYQWAGTELLSSANYRTTSKGYVIDAVATPWGRIFNGLASHALHVAELKSKLGGYKWAVTYTIEQQFLCHVAGNFFEPGVYNMESWRPGMAWGLQLNPVTRCNP